MILAPYTQGTFVIVWRHFWLSHLGGEGWYYLWVDARDTTKHPTYIGQPLGLLAQNVNSVKFEKSYSKSYKKVVYWTWFPLRVSKAVIRQYSFWKTSLALFSSPIFLFRLWYKKKQVLSLILIKWSLFTHALVSPIIPKNHPSY